MSHADTGMSKAQDIAALMAEIGRKARAAARRWPSPARSQERRADAMADAVLRSEGGISSKPMRSTWPMARKPACRQPSIDRLKLTPPASREMADGIRAIAALTDPVGEVIAEWDRPNGLKIERVRTPLGVIGVIFESRPNVTADAGALCLKAGNAGDPARRLGFAAFIAAIHACLVEGLKAAGLPEDAIQLVPVTDRAAVGEMLRGLAAIIDVIVPRGGKSLVARVQNEARVPVFAHLEGICHSISIARPSSTWR